MRKQLKPTRYNYNGCDIELTPNGWVVERWCYGDSEKSVLKDITNVWANTKRFGFRTTDYESKYDVAYFNTAEEAAEVIDKI